VREIRSAKATALRRYGAEDQALTLEECAADLEDAWRLWETEPLTLEEAATESGYSYSTLQQMTASGRLRNIGEKHRPRVCREDLPKKATSPAGESLITGPDLAQEVIARRLTRNATAARSRRASRPALVGR